MRSLLLILVGLIFLGCAHQPSRKMASVASPLKLGIVDVSQSMLKLFPPENMAHIHEHTFYLETRDADKKLIDIDPSDLQVKEGKKKLKPRLQRYSRGRYTFTIKKKKLRLSKLRVKVQGNNFDQEHKRPQIPVKYNSRVEKVYNSRHELRLRFTLKDAKGSYVELTELPEIFIDGHVSVVMRDLQMVRKGVWEVSVLYPEINQIFYVSIRANGLLLENLYRFQHVEK